MGPRKDEVALVKVTAAEEPPDVVSSPDSLESSILGQGVHVESCQKRTPDSPAAEGRNRCAKGLFPWPQCKRNLLRNRLVLMAIPCLISGALGFLIAHVTGSCPPESPSCPNKWIRSDGKCYFISRETYNWKSSLEFCQSEGGMLLATDYETQKEIKTLYDLTGDYWVGLKKDADSGKWRQLDGSVWTGPIEFDDPRRSCSFLDSGKYVAIDCSAHRRWICVKFLQRDH